MYIIQQSYEKAKFADIERHAEREQQMLEYMEDDILFGNTTNQASFQRIFWRAIFGLLAQFTTAFYR